MNEPDTGHAHAQSRDTNPDFRGAHGVIMQVETLGKGVAAVLIGGVLLAILLAGMAYSRTDVAIEQARVAERETKLAREDIRVMSIALARHGVSTDEHSIETGETK